MLWPTTTKSPPSIPHPFLLSLSVKKKISQEFKRIKTRFGIIILEFEQHYSIVNIALLLQVYSYESLEQHNLKMISFFHLFKKYKLYIGRITDLPHTA